MRSTNTSFHGTQAFLDLVRAQYLREQLMLLYGCLVASFGRANVTKWIELAGMFIGRLRP